MKRFSLPVGCRVLLFVLVGFALQCRPMLPPRTTIERESSSKAIHFTNEDVTAEELLYARLADGCADPENAKCSGVPLRSGDVIYLRRWFPSTNLRDAHDLHWTGPQSYTQRLPLRLVAESEKGMLYPRHRQDCLVAACLVDFISVGRINA